LFNQVIKVVLVFILIFQERSHVLHRVSERQPARQQLEKHDSDRVFVSFGVVAVVGFGRTVPMGADADGADLFGVEVDGAGKAEVGQFDVPVRVQQDISWLDISMGDVELAAVLACLNYLVDD